jgi:hypothetical protein
MASRRLQDNNMEIILESDSDGDSEDEGEERTGGGGLNA